MKIKKTMGEKIFDAANIVFMAIVIVAILYPFLYIVSQSFNEGVDSAQGGIYFFPRNFTLTNYQAVFQNDNLLSGFAVSILRTVIGTVTAVFFTAPGGCVTLAGADTGRRLDVGLVDGMARAAFTAQMRAGALSAKLGEGLSEELRRALTKLGYEAREPFPLEAFFAKKSCGCGR